MPQKIFILIASLFLLLAIVSPVLPVRAADSMKLNVPIGALSAVDVSGNGLGLYFSAWYKFLTGAVGIMATIMIMYGGFKWLTSRGGGDVGQAKDIIFSSLLGLTLALLSYIILNTINPQLLKITMPSFANITGGGTYNPAEMQFNDMGSTANQPLNQGTQMANTRTLEGTNIGVGQNVRVDGLQSTVIDDATSIQKACADANDGTCNAAITSAFRPGENSNHGNGTAVDFSRGNPAFNNEMQSIIDQPSTSKDGLDDHGQQIYNVTFPNGQPGRIIDEPIDNCWHIDRGHSKS